MKPVSWVWPDGSETTSMAPWKSWPWAASSNKRPCAASCGRGRGPRASMKSRNRRPNPSLVSKLIGSKEHGNPMHSTRGTNCDHLKKLIREVPDFPKKGILFYDITTLLKDKVGFATLIDALSEHYLNSQVDTVLAIEARGFIFGPARSEERRVGQESAV